MDKLISVGDEVTRTRWAIIVRAINMYEFGS
jgi:hypothetical protein